MARPPIHRGASETPQKLGRMTYCANPKWCEECPWDGRARELRLVAYVDTLAQQSHSSSASRSQGWFENGGFTPLPPHSPWK